MTTEIIGKFIATGNRTVSRGSIIFSLSKEIYGTCETLHRLHASSIAISNYNGATELIIPEANSS